LFKELKPIIESLSLSPEATRYYAQWAVKAKTTQITDIIDPHKRYLYLITFIDHYYKVWQDTFVDILLRCVQQQLNKAANQLNIIAKNKVQNKNKLASSVLSGFHETKTTIEAVRKTLHNDVLNNDEKIEKLYTIVPKETTNLSLIQAEKDAEKLKIQLDSEETQKDQFDILSNLSRKLQNRVADIVKNLDFEASNTAAALYAAIIHYQSENLTPTAPDEFLDEHEYNAIHRDGKFNVSLYKAILFCKISNAIKSGQLNLLSSYRYLSIEAYLIDEAEWGKNKHLILERLGLSHFKNIEEILSTLRELLTKQFIDVNQRIIQGDNKYVTIKKDGTFSLRTPPIQKPDYDAISVIIGKDRYVPILQMMAKMNALCNFTSNFKHYKIKGAKEKPDNEIFYAGIFALGSKIGLHKLANTAVGINYHTLSNAVNWYFSLDNLYMVNQTLIDLISKLWLPSKFKREKNLLHTSSDGQKENVSVESLNANYSYKYHGNGRGASIYRFIDERGILFYTTVFSSSERDAAYVIDGLLHNEILQSDIHSTDTHGYTEMIFAISHLIGVTFAPRIKDIASVNLVSFEKIKSANDNYPIKPDHYVKDNKIVRNWENILRLVATIMLRKHRASTILKRLSGYANQHPLQEALKEFGRIIKSIFALKYIDDVTWRQMIEKQLNKGELANKFASAVSFADQEIAEAYQNDQEISALCKTIIQNIIILWNYIELTKIIMRSDKVDREALLDDITSASILTWRHVNLHGTYDFSNLTAANDSDYSLEEVIAFKAA
jgi:TnpA family transposase